MSKRKRVQKAHPTVKTRQIFLSIFRTITYLIFAVIEGWTGPSTFWKVQFSNLVIYLLHICIVFHNLSVFVCIQTGKWKEKSPLVFTQLGEGSENRCFRIFDPFSQPTCLGPRSQVGKGLFSDPSPIRIASKPENRVAGSHQWCVRTLVLITYRWLESDPWLDLQGLHMDGQSWGKLVWSCTEVMVIWPYS